MSYTSAFDDLIAELKQFPGIGQRSAERLAFQVLKMAPEEVRVLAGVFMKAKETVQYCKVCHNLCESEICTVCQNSTRYRDILCVVETPKDVACIEESGEYQGLYHVLLGVLSPLEGISPKDLRIDELIERIEKEQIKEIIFALNSSMEGEATVLYIVNLLKPYSVTLSRLASGIPVGMSLEYADKATLAKAFQGRTSLV